MVFKSAKIPWVVFSSEFTFQGTDQEDPDMGLQYFDSASAEIRFLIMATNEMR